MKGGKREVRSKQNGSKIGEIIDRQGMQNKNGNG